MQDQVLGYREVIPDQTSLDTWKEISFNTGGTQGTLQDIKVTERANGYCYKDSSQHHLRNRYIYWRISHDILELVEHSLDINLAGNRIRYKFVDTPILDGVSIYETNENVIVLVPTVCSVHRLVFPHPDKYHRQDDILGIHPDLAAPSIFSEATVSDIRNPNTFHFFNTNTLPHLADSYLNSTEDAIFIFAFPSTDELLLIQQNRDGSIESLDLKTESIVPRFLSGLADKLRHKDKDADQTVSVLLQTFLVETYVIQLCRNGHLKFWSCVKGECVAVIDVMSEISCMTSSKQAPQNYVMRKSPPSNDPKDCLLGLFLSYSYEGQIHVFKPVVGKTEVKLTRLTTLKLPQNDLIDFALSSSRVWAIWRTRDGECEVKTASLLQSETWSSVALETVPDSTQPPNMDSATETDPRQFYLQYIFQAGIFPLHIIGKALTIYKQSPFMGELNLSATHLRQQICMAVEDQIQKELNENVVTDEDYLDCAHYCWQRFYSCCVQYHVAGLKPLGLLLFPYSSGAVLLKKSMISFLRPLDVLEALSYEICSSDRLLVEPLQITDDPKEIDDIMVLFNAINYLQQQVSEVFAYTFEKELSLLQSPDVVMAALIQRIQSEMDNEFTNNVVEILRDCSDLYRAVDKILEILRVDQSKYATTPLGDHAHSHVFTSQLGVSMVTGCLRQQAQVRFSICRNLLMICQILIEHREMDWKVLEAIRSVCMPDIVVLTQANYIVVWLGRLTAMPTLPTETYLQRLSSLKLNPVFNLRLNPLNTVSLLELFAGSTGGYEARKIFAAIIQDGDGESLGEWQSSLLPYLSAMFHIVCPTSGTTILAEWLLSCGQHLNLRQYVRYLNRWCDWNRCTHTFLCGVSMLANGEMYKAKDLFHQAARGVGTDDFLAHRFVNLEQVNREMDTTEECASHKAFVTYYLKVINLFELHKALDCAIDVAVTALNITPQTDPLCATLYSIKFKHYLELKHYQRAYEALDSNPDCERKKDNLRDLAKKLLDDRKFDVLLNFTYGGMEELFCNIIFTRARACDPSNNIYYDFLYSYLVKRGPMFMRLAASVMYEHAFRLRQCHDADALELQVTRLLGAKNALLLVDPSHAYVVMPVEQPEEKIIELSGDTLTQEGAETLVLKNCIDIVNTDTVSKELTFASSKLKLIRFNPKALFEITSPRELVFLLTNSCLFKTALKVAQTFDLGYESIFETLTRRCCQLLKKNDPQAWQWLSENDVQDLPFNIKSAADAAWNLLQVLLVKWEEPKLSTLHKVVAREIIKADMWLPTWLLASYKKTNPNELFRLFYSTMRIEEAIEIAVDYLKAGLGYGKEHFGLKYSLGANNKAQLCLPLNKIFELICQLEGEIDEDPSCPLLGQYELLREVYDTYVTTATRLTGDLERMTYSVRNNL